MNNVSWVRRGGPLAPFADGYGAELSRLGFTHHSVVAHVVLMGQLSRWMSDAGIVAGDLTESRVSAMLAGEAGRTGCRRPGHWSRCSGIVPELRYRPAATGGCSGSPGGSAVPLPALSAGGPRAGAVNGGQLRGNSAGVLVGAHADGRRRDGGGGPVRRRRDRVLAPRVFPASGRVSQEQGEPPAVAAAVSPARGRDRGEPRVGRAARGRLAGHPRCLPRWRPAMSPGCWRAANGHGRLLRDFAILTLWPAWGCGPVKSRVWNSMTSTGAGASCACGARAGAGILCRC